MKRMTTCATAALLTLFVSAAARPAAGSETWVHKGGRVRGLIMTLACEPIPDARIKVSGRKLTQLVTPDRGGHFIVELPAGKYQVSVSVPGRGEVTAEELVFGQARNGQLQLSVDMGAYLMHSGCFGESIEDLLIPDERVVTSDKLLGRPPASKP